MILATDEDTKVKDAVALRFKELCEERNISPNALAVRSSITPSTVYSMLDSSQQRALPDAGRTGRPLECQRPPPPQS